MRLEMPLDTFHIPLNTTNGTRAQMHMIFFKYTWQDPGIFLYCRICVDGRQPCLVVPFVEKLIRYVLKKITIVGGHDVSTATH